MLDNRYPFNLIRAIYGDNPDDDTHAATTHIQGLFEMLTTLTDQEQYVLSMRYQEGRTYASCAEMLDLTPPRVRQIATKAFRKLRQKHRMEQHQAVRNAKCRELKDQHDNLKVENEQLQSVIIRLNQHELNPESIIMMADIVKPEDLNTEIEWLDLSTRSYNALCRAGIRTINDVLTTPDEKLNTLQNLGAKSIHEIKSKIRAYILLPDTYREPSENT